MKVANVNPSIQEKFIIKLANTKSNLGIMCRDTDWKFTSKFTGRFDSNNKRFWITNPRGIDLFEIESLIEQHNNKVFVATVNCNNELYGLHFEIIGLDNHGVICSFPTEVYQMNRRQSKRFKIPSHIDAKLVANFIMPKISYDPIEFQIIDISIHGLSVKVPEKFRTIFHKHMIIPSVYLKIGARNIKVSFEIRNMFENPQDTIYPYKVGGKFIKIDDIDQFEINKYILKYKDFK